MRKLPYIFSLIFSGILLFSGCKEEKLEEFLSDFRLYEAYIESFNPRHISAYDTIRIKFSQDLPEKILEKEGGKNWFAFSPEIEGEVQIHDNNSLYFIPNEPLEQNQEYRVTLHLSKLFDVPKQLKEFNFAVQTYEQNFLVRIDDLQSYDRDYQYLNGSIEAMDFMPLEDTKKLISAQQDGKEISVKFHKNKELSRVFEFYVDSIERGMNRSNIEVFWDGEPLNIDEKGKARKTIPGKNEFKIISAEVSFEDKQVVKVNFSDPIEKRQNLSGLARIQDGGELKFMIRGNLLHIYPEEQVVGMKNMRVFQGIKSIDGVILKTDYVKALNFEELMPEVRFISSGTILPSSENLKINFEAVNLSAVDVTVHRIHSSNIFQFLQTNDLDEGSALYRVSAPVAQTVFTLNHPTPKSHTRWNSYAIDLSSIMKVDPGAIYRVELSMRPEYSLYSCAVPLPKKKTDGNRKPFNPSEHDLRNGYDYWDYDDYYMGYDYVDWSESDNPCNVAYYIDKSVGTNVLASDLGVIAKRGEQGDYLFAVSDLVSAKPVSGALVELFTFDQQLIGKFKTNSEGIAITKTDRYAFFARVSKGKQTTPVKLAANYSNSLSSFDVSGAKLEEGLNGYIYGERGVWRPGDTLFLGFILNNKNTTEIAKHPIKLSIYNARGIEIHNEVARYTESNHYAFQVPTSSDAETGNWEAKVQVGGASFRKTLFVETVKPNRLKISTKLNNSVLSVGENNSGSMLVSWLHGAVAKNLKVDLSVKYVASKTNFKGYESYTFDDPSRSFEVEETKVLESNLDESGSLKFNLEPSFENEAPGMIKAIFMARAFEKGGDFSTDVFSSQVSPYKRYIGLKSVSENKYGYHETGKTNRFELVCVDKNGKPFPAQGLSVKVYRLEHYWWYDASSSQLSEYTSGTAHLPYKSVRLNTDRQGKASFSFDVDDYDWGNYLIRVYDPVYHHATGDTYYFDWPVDRSYRRPRDNESSEATKLVFLTDKKEYQVGETMQLTFPSAENCRAFVSIESANKVLQHQWVNTSKNETVVKIPVKAEMAPNVYAHITLIQPHANTENDSPIRLYGVQSISVHDKSTILQPKITLPKTIKPESNYTVQVAETSGQAMTYTLAVVDEGLLDLTRFKTPNAWNLFYARQALGIKTWDIYDHVIGAFGGKLSQIFSVGGDESLERGNPKKANRFKPVVTVLGPFELKAGQTAKHQLKMPNYVGSVRAMVVASNVKKFAYGSAEETSKVKKPLMLLASAPRQLSPTEKISLPVTVFAMEKNIKNVQVNVKAQGAIKPIGETSKRISFNQPDDQVVYFDFEVGEKQGTSKIQVFASSGSEKALYEVELNVSNPNLPSFKVYELDLESGKSGTLSFEAFGISGSNKAYLEASNLPAMNLHERLSSLLAYPHGCLEQRTSKLFPQLYLDQLVSFTDSEKERNQKNIKAGIEKLKHYQLPSGGFGYWPGSNNVNHWATNYVGHFLIEAEKKGYEIPVGFKGSWLRFQRITSRQWNYDQNRSNDVEQAYRLYTLALAGEPELAAMNRLKSTDGIQMDAKLRLAAAYALAGQKKAAYDLIYKFDIAFISSERNSYFGSFERNCAMALETFVTLGDKAKAKNMSKIVAKALNGKGWLSTQSAGYSILAMGKYAKLVGGMNFKFSYQSNGKQITKSSSKPLLQESLVVKGGVNQVKLKNLGSSFLNFRVISEGILPIGEEQSYERGLDLNVSYADGSGAPVDLSNLTQGSDVFARITVKNVGGSNVDNLALSHIIASGFEIVNTRYTAFNTEFGDEVDYIDVRDDRTNFYFSLKVGESKTFRIPLSASYPGRYYLPGAQVEGMYDHDFAARVSGQWIVISKE